MVGVWDGQGWWSGFGMVVGVWDGQGWWSGMVVGVWDGQGWWSGFGMVRILDFLLQACFSSMREEKQTWRIKSKKQQENERVQRLGAYPFCA